MVGGRHFGELAIYWLSDIARVKSREIGEKELCSPEMGSRGDRLLSA